MRRVGVMLGSFDPPHRGHALAARALLDRSAVQALVLLVPARHFEKVIVPGKNASLDQRLRMLAHVGVDLARAGRPVLVGVAHEVLFVRLAQLIRRRFRAEPHFAMGPDTHRKVAASRRYFEQLGLPWGAPEQRELLRLLHRGITVVPRALGLSSTLVRSAAAAAWRTGDPRRVASAVGALVSPEVAQEIIDAGLYDQLDLRQPVNHCASRAPMSALASGPSLATGRTQPK